MLAVKDVKAGVLRARVLYAKDVKARTGYVTRFVPDASTWEQGRSDSDVEAPEIEADVIYAKDVDAERIEASEVHAKELTMQR